MFRIECFCDDKALARVMRALAGQVKDLKVVPVANVQVKNGKMTAETGGSMLEMLELELKKTKADHVTPTQLREFVAARGRAASSYSNLLRSAVAAGLLKKLSKAKGNGYAVVVKR